jgi:heat shock protein HslJ
MYFSEIGAELPEVEGEIGGATATPSAPAAEDGTGTITAPDGVNMRLGPGAAYSVVGIIPDGTVVTIVGVSQDREWWLVENPENIDEQVWISRNFVQTSTSVNDVPTIADPEIEPTLLDNAWQWLSLTTPTETTAVSDPSLYTIQFNADGSATLRADCNTLTASYTSAENNIRISTGATTLVACPGDSLDALYLNTLTQVTTYFFEAGGLYLELPADGGTMHFAPDNPAVPEQPEEPETPAETTPTPTPTPPAAEGDFFKVTSFGATGSEKAVLAGTEITAVFTETRITGNAGCNDYSGTLTRTADSFTVSNLIATEKACTEPAGIMEQEQAYLAALADVVAFSWEEQLSDDGNSIVTVGQLFYVTSSNGIINMVTP